MHYGHYGRDDTGQFLAHYGHNNHRSTNYFISKYSFLVCHPEGGAGTFLMEHMPKSTQRVGGCIS